MPSWKKILQSGSAVHVLNITASSLPNSLQPNIIGYDTASGRFTFFSTSSLVSGGSVIGGSGTANYITRWSGGTTITTSSIYESSSRIGIGTITPQGPLHIRGTSVEGITPAVFLDTNGTDSNEPVDIRLASGSARGIRIIASSSLSNIPGGASIQFYSNNSATFGGTLHIDSGTTGSSALIFRTANTATPVTERMRIAGNGTVSITGSGPTSATTILSITDSNLTTRFTILGDGTSAFNTNHLYISGSGLVGIGTTSPTAKLEVLDSFTVSASSGQFADVKFRLLTQSYKNHVLTYDETTGQIYYFSSSLEATTPTCNPPIPSITIISSGNVCSGSATILQADNLNNLQPIGTLTYQWSASGAPILDATTSRYEPIITAHTTFTVRMCDGVCCNTASVDIWVVPHNTITLSSSFGTDNQTVSVLTSITPITYTTTGATGATVTGLPSGVSGSWSAGPPDTFTIGGVPTQTGTFNYTVTMTGGCTGGVNTAQGTIIVNAIAGGTGTHIISGSVRYNNTAQTAMTNTTVQLLSGSNSIVVHTALTDANGYYEMRFDIPTIGGAGTYSLKAVTNKPWGGVNALDALAIARHFTGAAPLVGLRLAAADVNGTSTINSLDALTTSRRFSGMITSFNVGNWRSENLPINLANSPTQYNQNILMICFGDTNGSYVPNTAL